MIRSGLLGRSILASRSPELHEQEAAAQGLDLSYELFDFSDRGWSDDELGTVMGRLAVEGFSGFNVTYPFKQAVVPLLDNLDESALAVGAVNTVAVREGRLIGYNTDMAGFRGSFLATLPGAGTGRIVQLGAGGQAQPSPAPCCPSVSAGSIWSTWIKPARQVWPANCPRVSPAVTSVLQRRKALIRQPQTASSMPPLWGWLARQVCLWMQIAFFQPTGLPTLSISLRKPNSSGPHGQRGAAP